jgi:peptidoglycan/LPS O-acetylase OafA/YrhL
MFVSHINRDNNFDLLRVVFALFVIITHSFTLSGADKSIDILYAFTNGQIYLSEIGYQGFFIISGFLIFKSLKNATSLFVFFSKRIVRLFPGLIVMLILTLLIVLFINTNSFDILLHKDYWFYFINNVLLFRTQYMIEGVFDSVPYKGFVNGSLWTLAYEFLFYIILSFFFFIKNNIFFVRFFLIVTLIFSYFHIG